VIGDWNRGVAVGADGPPRYLALCYMLGRGVENVSMYQPTCEHASKRLKEDGLECAELPQTIKDAMQLVVHLGERHLWVDAVCFIQNVYEDRDAQIWSIDIVYGVSVLNIIATGDSNAQAGLPQASKSAADPVQHIETVRGLRLILPLFKLETVITKWSSCD
jgi:hypothetical protein